MIDTVKVKSPELPAEILDRIADCLRTHQTVENSTGEVLTEFTAASLSGTFDHRTRVEVCREEIKSIPAILTRSGKPEFFKAPCSHVIIEGSVHKAICGQNIAHGPEDPRAAIRWYAAHISERLGVDLPDGDGWQVMRLDWAECFDLGSFEACAEFVSQLRQAKFPRRKMVAFGNETVSTNGTTTGWKVYHKGPEFATHDRKRLRHHFTPEQVECIQSMADGILRTETAIKLKKLINDFDANPTVNRLTEAYVSAVHDRETERVIRESENDMNTVRHTQDVQRRLYETYGTRQGGHLYGTWLTFCTIPEEMLRSRLSLRTFYRQRKLLQDAGVSWFGSDVQVVSSAIPEGFSLRRSDPRRITGESDQVRKALMPYRTVAA